MRCRCTSRGSWSPSGLRDARGRIPQGLEPTLGPVATAFGEIYQYLVDGDGVDAMVAKTTHDWDIRTRLRSVSGVSEVNSWGGLTKQFQVVVDPPRLEQFGLALREVLDAIADNNQSFSGGFIEHRAERYTVRGVGLVANVADLERVVLKSHDGVPVLLRDVARRRGRADAAPAAPSRGTARAKPSAGMVIMLKGENGHDLSQRVKARMTEVAAALPPRHARSSRSTTRAR